MTNKPPINALKNPIIIGPVWIFERLLILEISIIPAPNNIGIANKNENRAASFWSIPDITAAAIVITARDIPGIIAKACAIPIIKTVVQFGVNIPCL